MLRVTLQSEGEERGLETGHNWISYGLPPMEMLLRPCGFDLQASSDNDCAVAYNYQYFLPPPPAPASTELKLEDLLGGDSGAHCSETLTVDGHDTSSVSTVLIQDLRAVDDSSSAPSTGLENTLGPPPQPPAAGHRTSVYRGVTRLGCRSCKLVRVCYYVAVVACNGLKQRQVMDKGIIDGKCCRYRHGGGYDREEKAARAYDLAALKYWGPTATTNFPVSCYSREIEEMKCMTKQEFIASIRRKSSGFSRGASIYRGVTRQEIQFFENIIRFSLMHHQHGRWQARIGRVAGNKDLYLGTFATEEEAAEAYDVAAIKFRGANAVTNFELSRYDVEAIANTELPIGASAKRIKQSLQSDQDQLPLDKSDKGQHLNFIDMPRSEYKPGPFDALLLQFFRKKMVQEVGWDSEKPGYVGLIEVANHLMIKGKTISETERSAVRVLVSLFPPLLLDLFKMLIAPINGGKVASMMLARATAMLCQWLMGPCSVNSVDLADGSSCSSGVFVERCKYLEESKCLGVCVNTCKLPTQTFFRDYMGVPLYMEPNFSDYSCQFNFGVPPPPPASDKALQEPCLGICPNASRRRELSGREIEQCPKV
ncbi:unnamed protein product [Musa acuminata var. zebrina]